MDDGQTDGQSDCYRVPTSGCGTLIKSRIENRDSVITCLEIRGPKGMKMVFFYISM